MKTYFTPTLIALGTVLERTQGALPGDNDGSGTQQVLPAGSIGFGL
jgi:hypothetical protein